MQVYTLAGADYMVVVPAAGEAGSPAEVLVEGSAVGELRQENC